MSAGYLGIQLTFSYYYGRELIAPIYAMSSLIDYGLFFQRVESIFMFIWSLSSLLSVSIIFYMVLLLYCHIFRISDKRPMVIPLTLILYSLSFIPKGISELTGIYMQILIRYGWILFFLPPGVVLAVSLFRRKKGRMKNA